VLHPWQTDTFDPSAAVLVSRIQSGERLTWLYLGATVYLVDGERWVAVNGYDYCQQGPKTLVYPLPESYGVEDIPAVQAFERALSREARTIAPPKAEAPPQPIAPPALAPPRLQPRKPPKGRPIVPDGAVPLPGLFD
jgi:hypothetical protein